jgi:exosortase
MLPALILGIFGSKVLRILQFPLGFLAFALPVGTSIEPWLQKIAAMFIMLGLDMVGIPYNRDGYFITIPSGTWEVAPDFGGLRYLLPGLALGYVYTAVMHHGLKHRLSFLVLCTLLLVLANGVRAYGVILGDHLGIAEGADHRVFSYVVYGATVIFLAWFGLSWRRDDLSDRALKAELILPERA